MNYGQGLAESSDLATILTRFVTMRKSSYHANFCYHSHKQESFCSTLAKMSICVSYCGMSLPITWSSEGLRQRMVGSGLAPGSLTSRPRLCRQNNSGGCQPKLQNSQAFAYCLSKFGLCCCTISGGAADDKKIKYCHSFAE